MAASEYQILDPRFARVFCGPAKVHKLYEGCRWAEGPAYFPAGRYLVWSDIPNNRMLRYDETDGAVGVFRQPANNSNGNTVDRQGRLVTCEHGSRRVTRTEHDGSVTVLADLARASASTRPTTWWSSPTARSGSPIRPTASTPTMRATRPRARSAPANVYRIDPATGDDQAIVTDDSCGPMAWPSRPTKACSMSPTPAASMASSIRPHIRVFDVDGDGGCRGGKVFADCTAGLFDGFRLDTEGRLWTSAGDGVHCYDPDGTLIGKILVPEVVANVCFGGPKRNRLFICGTTSLYSVRVFANGVKTF